MCKIKSHYETAAHNEGCIGTWHFCCFEMPNALKVNHLVDTRDLLEMKLSLGRKLVEYPPNECISCSLILQFLWKLNINTREGIKDDS